MRGRYSDLLRAGLSGDRNPVRKRFSAPILNALGHTQPPTQCVPGLSRGYSGLGLPFTTHASSAEVKERVELYNYSPGGTSWSVLG